MSLKSKFLAAMTATLVAVVGVALPASAAQAAPACGKPATYLLASGLLQENYNGNIYSSMPCKWGGQKAEALSAHFASVTNNIRMSHRYGWATAKYAQYQVAAKETLVKDVMAFSLQFFHVGGKKFNSGIRDVSGDLYTATNGDLSVGRASHVYKVLFFTESYLESQAFADEPFAIYQTYQDLTGIFKILKRDHEIYQLADLMLSFPSMDAIYSTFFNKMRAVVGQSIYTDVQDTFSLRIQGALTD